MGTLPASALYIGHQWPQPDASAAGHRSLQVLQILQELGMTVHFGCVTTRTDRAFPLESIGVHCHPLKLNSDSFDQILESYGFTLVVFDRFTVEEQFSWRVRDRLPLARTLLDMQDLHSLRYSRKKAFRNGKPWTTDCWVAEPAFYRELASILRTDLALVISKEEVELLTTQLPMLRDQLCYLPMGWEPPDHNAVGFAGRSGFLMIGTGKHAPNVDAFAYLAKEVWPFIRAQLHEARLDLIGAYLPVEVTRLHSPEQGIYIHEDVEDLGPMLHQARLQLAPLRFGAGIKGKILHGLQCGLPVLTSPVGAEGLFAKTAPDLFVATGTEAFVSNAISLYTDQLRWEHALEIQRQQTREHFYAHRHWATHLEAALLGKEGRPKNTQAAILRNLLRQKAFDSYRFMSRWIAEKNKGASGPR